MKHRRSYFGKTTPPQPRQRNAKLIESFSYGDIVRWKKDYDSAREFHAAFYEQTASQRAVLASEITASLKEAGKPFEFSEWTRIVDYQYSLEPLSTRGSYLNDPGGRFNIGDIDKFRFPGFSALYIAENYETAVKEAFTSCDVEVQENSFIGNKQFTRVILRGSLRQVCDLREPEALREYLTVIKKVNLSKKLVSRSKKNNMRLVASLEDLLGSIMHTYWRNIPQIFDIPSTSQIFGVQLLKAGFDGVVYKSVKDGGCCIAVFPRNFENSDSFVEIGSDCPEELPIETRRISSENWWNYWHSGI